MLRDFLKMQIQGQSVVLRDFLSPAAERVSAFFDGFLSEIFQALPLYTHLQHHKIDVKNCQKLSKSEISKFVKKK